MIAVVDSGVANLASVMAALHRLRAEAEITCDATKIMKAERVIVPGVGSAVAAMEQLRTKKLLDTLKSLTQPVLGICLGMQVLFSGSDEGAGVACLGIIPGRIKRIKASVNTPVPHMGWNSVTAKISDHPLLRGVMPESFVYFVHSFAAPVASYTVATTEYGESFSSIVQEKNYFGCQFHPERSSSAGSLILQNFMGF